MLISGQVGQHVALKQIYTIYTYNYRLHQPISTCKDFFLKIRKSRMVRYAMAKVDAKYTYMQCITHYVLCM